VNDYKEYLGEIGLAQEFLDYVDQRSGLIKGNGGELDKPTSYSFPHRTFQEYLAGCYLIRDRSAAREYYRHAAEGDFWALSAQLGAEELYYNRRGQPYMRDLAYELLTSPQPANVTDQRAGLWSGMIARIAGLEEIEADLDSPKGGPKYIGQIRPALLQVMQGNLPPIERAEAGRVLAKLGDPRLDVLTCEQMAFCHVAAGDFLMGDKKEKTPMPQEYWMGKTPVTNAQFAQFVAARGYQNPDYWQEAIKEKYWSKDGFKGRYDNTPRISPADYGEPFNLPNHPVVGVSWYEARAFTRWLSEQLALGRAEGWSVNNGQDAFRKYLHASKLRAGLPTEEQWEKAARGTDGRKYPWGENADPNRANYADTGIGATSALGCFPGGESPYGILDASGNVWEWVAEPGRLRGGSFSNSVGSLRCAYRSQCDPDLRGWNLGFRVMVSPLLLSHL
jgi:formylglycine-generating enzyme required for sulfatase activity